MKNEDLLMMAVANIRLSIKAGDTFKLKDLFTPSYWKDMGGKCKSFGRYFSKIVDEKKQIPNVEKVTNRKVSPLLYRKISD